MKSFSIQTNFTSGELDPRMASRIDVQQYYNGAERLRNVTVNPLGGAVRAAGLEHIGILEPLVLAVEGTITPTAPNGGTAANALDGDFNTLLTTTGAIGVVNPYVVAHYDCGAAVEVRSAEIIGASINVPITSAGNSGLRIPSANSNDGSIGTKPWTFPSSGGAAFSCSFNSNGFSHYLRCQNPNIASLIPPDATIVGVEVQITRREHSTGVGTLAATDREIRLIVGGVIVGDNKSAGAAWGATFATGTYGGAADTWGFNLTREQVARDDFGVAIAITGVLSGLGAFALIQSVRMNVYYTTDAIASPSEFAIQYSPDNVVWTTYGSAFAVRDNDEVSFRHTDVITARYWRYARIGATDLGTAVAQIRDFNLFANLTTFAETGGLSDCCFVDFDFSLDQKYMIVFTDRNAAVYENGILQVNVPAPYTSAQLSLLRFDQRLDTVALFHPDVPPQLMQRQGAANKWVLKAMVFEYIPQHAFEMVTTTPNQTLTISGTIGSILITAGGSAFVSTDEGQYINANGGRARIYQYISATQVRARVEISFLDTETISAQSWQLERGYEDAWSVTRGWPICGAFYQQRLWIGGSRSLPDRINGSRLGLYFDFNLGRGEADDGIEADLENRDVAGILNVATAGHLQFFTKTGEFYIPQAANEALTPSNFLPRKADNVGSRVGTNVVSADGVNVFIQTEGQSIQKLGLARTAEEAAQNSIYAAEDISTFSSHLIVTPVQLGFRKATSTNDPNLLLVVNSDGTLAICTMLQTQGVNAWTLRSTNGLIKRVGVIGNEIYVMVERSVDGVANRFIERFNNDCQADGAFLVDVDTATTTVTGLAPYFENEEVVIVLDNAIQNPGTVVGGELTFDRAAEESYQIGFAYDTLVRPMPAARNPDGGANLSGKKRVLQVLLMLFETRWAEVNGQPIGLQQFGAQILDQTLQPFTGRKTVDGLLGWTEEGQFDITQGGVPASMTLTGIEIEISL